MEKRRVKLRGAFVELNKLLKFENLVASGGEAKAAIQSGLVSVNDEVESRVRRKLVAGDVVTLSSTSIEISGAEDGV